MKQEKHQWVKARLHALLNNTFSRNFNHSVPPLWAEDSLSFTSALDSPWRGSSLSDGISTKMLKGTATAITTPALTKLLSLSISLGRLPQNWKVSSVVPSPQCSGTINNPNTGNFRLISLLPVVLKSICKHLYEHLAEKGLLMTNKWEFTSDKSTMIALLTTVQTILQKFLNLAWIFIFSFSSWAKHLTVYYISPITKTSCYKTSWVVIYLEFMSK